jgi:acetolactate decarboxylase
VLDQRLVANLHVQALRRSETHAEHEPHVVFQASTIAALLEGAYDGDLTFAELAGHGDLGLGTLNGLDGEMISLDGRFYRADVDGAVHAVPGSARTPFAVVVAFEPTLDVRLPAPLDLQGLIAEIDVQLGGSDAACAVRFDGAFDLVRARSVPRQHRPYRPLAEVAAEQHVFDLCDVSGTLVGFRFPDYAGGVEVTGHHLHFISDDRRRGGHVLGCEARGGRLRLDRSSDLHVELPPGVELGAGHVDEAALGRIERGG